MIYILGSNNVNRSRPRTIPSNQYSVQVCGRNSAITLAEQIAFILRKTSANTNTNTCANTTQCAIFPFLCMLYAYIFFYLFDDSIMMTFWSRQLRSSGAKSVRVINDTWHHLRSVDGLACVTSPINPPPPPPYSLPKLPSAISFIWASAGGTGGGGAERIHALSCLFS